jgi:asparagine synthase (glutamine-hydrolysing)
MSGIVGIFNLDGAPVDRELLRRMTASMAFRGPDAQEIWSDGPIGFGHTMLRTTFEAEHEHQPMTLDGQVWITADCRVDGRSDLIRELAGHDRRVDSSAPDPELILHAYHIWGEDCVKYILGDFAFAIWDARRNRIYLGRDFLGIRPLYYVGSGPFLLFSSEIGPLLQHPSVRRKPNEGMVAEYLTGELVSIEDTVYEGIRRLAPAHYVVCNNRRMQKKCYWQPDRNREIKYTTDQQYAEHYLSIFETAIEDRLRCCGRVGAHLSGGLDSSSVVGTAHRLFGGDRPSQEKLETFSSVYPGDKEADESAYIDDMLRTCSVQSFRVQPERPDVVDYAPDAKRYGDFPGYPNGRMADLLLEKVRSRGVRVLLTGYGGDEWLFGSPARPSDLIKTRNWKQLISQLRAYTKSHGFAETAHILFRSGLFQLLPAAMRRSVKEMSSRFRDFTPLDKDFANRIGFHRRSDKRIKSGKDFPRESVIELLHWGSNVHGREIEERYGSNFGIELRHPFHDRRLVEFAIALPAEQRYRDGMSKVILRQAMRGRIPESIRLRRDKADFSAVFPKALRANCSRLCGGLTATTAMMVKPGHVRDLYARVMRRFECGDRRYRDEMWRLWMILGIDFWISESLEGPPLETPILSPFQCRDSHAA